MASPVLKRLEEIERTHLAYARCGGPDFCNLAFLLKLTRALLESQGELLEELKSYVCCVKGQNNRCSTCEAIARAEEIQRGEV